MKIIIFNIGETVYGVKMDNIKEIMPYPNRIAKLPNQKNYIIGVTNIRGVVSVIINLGELFVTKHNDKKFLMVLEKGGSIISFPTETMPQTLDVSLDNMSTDFVGKSEYFQGVINTKIGIVVLLKEDLLFKNNLINEKQ